MPSTSRNARSRAHHVGDGDHREVDAVRPAGRRVDRRRSGGAAAPAEQVGRDHEVAIGVERLAGADHAVPPAEALAARCRRDRRRRSRRACSRPAARGAKPAAWASPLSAWQTRMTLSRAGGERAVGFVGDADRMERRARTRAAADPAGRGTASRPCRPSRRRPSAHVVRHGAASYRRFRPNRRGDADVRSAGTAVV